MPPSPLPQKGYPKSVYNGGSPRGADGELASASQVLVQESGASSG